MIRTQIYLPDDIYHDLKLLSKTKKVKFSHLIRKGAERVLSEEKKAVKKDAWKDFIGAIKGGPKTNAVKDIQDYYKHGVVK